MLGEWVASGPDRHDLELYDPGLELILKAGRTKKSSRDGTPGRIRPGGHVGYVGVAHDVELPGEELFLHGGLAPVRRFLPELIRLIWDREIDPGKVFDLTLPIEDAAEGFQAMDQRRAIKVLLTL
jgi:threonine dehydrogenase-like Zn-dependent dehydrogenase